KRRNLVESDGLDQPLHGGARFAVKTLSDLLSEPRYRRRQFLGSARRLPQPERDGRRLAVCVLDAHRTPLDAQYSIGSIPQLKYIALQTLDGKVLVDGAH